MTIYDQIAAKIILEQEAIVGPVAWNEAGKVSGLTVLDKKSGNIQIDEKDSQSIVNNLVGRFESLFGRTGREVCKAAVSSLLADLPPAEVPNSLK